MFSTVAEAEVWLDKNANGPCCIEVEGLGEVLFNEEERLGCIAGRKMKPWQLSLLWGS